jgi:hypothetical protein
MITTIAEHTVDLDLLPERGTILDLGCRNFQFTNYFREKYHQVFSVDMDHIEGQAYYQCAITDHDGRCGILKTSDKQATRVKEGSEIPCYTLDTFMQACGVKRFDLIKMDVEGAEYQIIMNQQKAPCKQWSIEFHLHTGIYTQKEMKEMEDKLMDLGYEAVHHKLTTEHGAGYNYWDSLFVHYK